MDDKDRELEKELLDLGDASMEESELDAFTNEFLDEINADKRSGQRIYNQGEKSSASSQSGKGGAGKKQGPFAVKVDAANNRALIDIFPDSEGKNEIKLETVLAVLAEKKIVFGIDEDAIEKALKKAAKSKEGLKEVVAAKGMDPEVGSNAKLVFHIDKDIKELYKKDKAGKVDYRQKKNVITVDEGAKIFTFYPEKRAGRRGCDVFGKEIEARDGMPLTFSVGSGIRREEQSDGSAVFFSNVSGKFIENKEQKFYDVFHMLEIEMLDIHYGNLDFDGDVIVRKNIRTGMVVNVGGDLIVNGSIGNACVTVKGNLICDGGILTGEKGYIVCYKDITTKFIEKSRVKCLGDMTVKKAIFSSEVKINGSLYMTEQGSHLVGGVTMVRQNIECLNVGNKANVPTTIYLNYDFAVNDQIAKLVKLILSDKEKLAGANQALETLISAHGTNAAALPAEVKKQMQTILVTRKKILAQMGSYKESVEKLKNSNVLPDVSTLKVFDAVYQGTVLVFDQIQEAIGISLKSVMFIKERDKKELKHKDIPTAKK